MTLARGDRADARGAPSGSTPAGPLHVLVLGGGLAGLAAATRLAEQGARVTLVEGRGALGGRAQSFVHQATGDDVDTGQHVLLGCYHEMLSYLERIGTRELVRLQPSLRVALAGPGGARAVLACPEIPAPWHLAVGLMRYGALTLPDKLRCLRVLGDARARWDDPALDAITVTEWMDSMGQSEQARRMLWTPLTLATLNASSDHAAASMLAVVIAWGLLAGGQSSSIGLSTVGLSALHAEPARAYVTARGGVVMLNQPASALVVEDGRCVGASLRDGEVTRADVVVSAVPAGTLLALLPVGLRGQAPFDGLSLFRPSPIVSLHAWLDRKVLDCPFVGFTHGDAHWAFDREATWGEGAKGGHLITIVSSGADELAADDRDSVFRRLWAGLVDAVPGAAAARILHWEVVKERSATFSAVPGLNARRFGPSTPLPGLLVAGDWTATGLPATMEGACASGHAAAAAADGHLRRHHVAPTPHVPERTNSASEPA